MQNIIETILTQIAVLITTIKWFFLAALSGLSTGIAIVLFLYLLEYGTEKVTTLEYFYLLLPFALFISAYLITKFSPEAEGQGTEKVIESIRYNKGNIHFKVFPIKLIATLITLIFGGSAGKVGPSAQIGASFSSIISKLANFNEEDRKRFMLCGISAGFSGVLGTPLAGAFFASELIFVGKLSYKNFLPSLISAYFSFFVTSYFNIEFLFVSISFQDNLNFLTLLNMFIFGVFIGIIAIIFISMFKLSKNIFNSLKIYTPLKAFLGGIIIIIFVYIMNSKDFLGVGSEFVINNYQGVEAPMSSFLQKIFTTSVTLTSGGSGGIISPIIFIGSSAGNFWAQLTGGNIALYSAIGTSAFLAACINAPLASIVLTMELFGLRLGSTGAIAVIISYLVIGHLSIYQVDAVIKNKVYFADKKIHEKIFGLYKKNNK